VGIGLTALWLELAESLGGGDRKLVPASAIFVLALVPLVLNWPYASRRGDYAARDFAYNLLQSVEPYGVLFTNGDNDTFPLWYLQEVEGVRKDVTVIVLSYLNTDWYPKQLRDLTSSCNGRNPASDPTRIICQRPFDPARAPRFYNGSRAPTRPILSMSDEEILGTAQTPAIQVTDQNTVFRARNVEATLPPGVYIEPKERFVLAIIKNAWGDRPIFFASTTNEQYDLGLAPFTARQGLAFKLVTPEESRALQPMPTGREFNPVLGAYYDVANGERLADQVFQFHGLEDRPHWTDDATRNIPTHYFYAYEALASAEDIRGNRAAVAKYDSIGRKYEALARR
jgi:hypothetical protein